MSTVPPTVLTAVGRQRAAAMLGEVNALRLELQRNVWAMEPKALASFHETVDRVARHLEVVLSLPTVNGETQ
jgi:hypothetical protein